MEKNPSNDQLLGENRDDGVVGGIVGGLENLSNLDWFQLCGGLMDIWSFLNLGEIFGNVWQSQSQNPSKFVGKFGAFGTAAGL